MALRHLGDAGERSLEYQGGNVPPGGELDSDARAERLAVEDEPVRGDRLPLEETEPSPCVDVESGFARGARIAAVSSIFQHQRAVAFLGKAQHAPGAMADMAAIAVKIEDDRPAGPRRQIPGSERHP